jgi:hypothetical protein
MSRQRRRRSASFSDIGTASPPLRAATFAGHRERNVLLEKKALYEEPKQRGIVYPIRGVILRFVSVHEEITDDGALGVAVYARLVNGYARPTTATIDPVGLGEDEPLVLHLLGDEAA